MRISPRRAVKRVPLSSIPIGIALLAVAMVVLVSSQPRSALDAAVSSHRFSIPGWELRQLSGRFFSLSFAGPSQPDEAAGIVEEYFAGVPRLNRLQFEADSGNVTVEAQLAALRAREMALRPQVESAIARQVQSVMADEGIFNHFAVLNIGFPPVTFKLSNLPDLLVVSPRDLIESSAEVLLRPGLSRDTKESIESRVDGAGVSSVVVGIGGIAVAYPPIGTVGPGLRDTVNTVAHEWTHQYLAFRPLGFLYVLDLTGIAPDYDVATINETVADRVGEEVSALVMKKYYPGFPEPARSMDTEFSGIMRETRQMVDAYLAKGQVEEAERYMQGRQQYLASRGYHIRKLNQAYFAFYGAYAGAPGSVSPIGKQVAQLRTGSDSLKEFLDSASGLTRVKDLEAAVR